MIRLYHVHKNYGPHHALRDVTLRVAKGEFVYVTGPSGAGKSTLLKLLYGAERPSEGKLLVGGVDASKLPARRLPFLRRNIGVIFQDFKLIPSRRVADNVGLGLEVLGTPRAEIDRRVRAVLNVVGLGGKEDRYPLDLSGGEQQRVSVARAIINDPAILLADEPTGNLDGAMAIEVMEILLSVNLRGTTVLVATHDVGLMDRFPKRRIRMVDGRIAEDRAR
ncbi:MAG: cell division ATP-binding protein FtsE [Alphaproteobacteria bacterium]|nr:cell division ATP-binding protein FtsE [Alphaproteobacteria bacterium]